MDKDRCATSWDVIKGIRLANPNFSNAASPLDIN